LPNVIEDIRFDIQLLQRVGLPERLIGIPKVAPLPRQTLVGAQRHPYSHRIAILSRLDVIMGV
jgi:hypothetical protein